jgi:hypothetical protein
MNVAADGEVIRREEENMDIPANPSSAGSMVATNSNHALG